MDRGQSWYRRLEGTSVNRRPLGWVLTVAVYLYLNLFVFPVIPILLTGDQVYFWTYGQRMLHG